MRCGWLVLARLPDLLFVAAAHLDRVTPQRLLGPADLVIELISPDSVGRDRTAKFQEYEAAGIPEYWLFDPRPGQQRSTFYRMTTRGRYEAVALDADGRYHSVVLPGFWLRPAWLWQEPLPNPVTALWEIAPEAIVAARPRSASQEDE